MGYSPEQQVIQTVVSEPNNLKIWIPVIVAVISVLGGAIVAFIKVIKQEARRWDGENSQEK